MEHFVVTVNGWKALTVITKSSNLDVAGVLDPPLNWYTETDTYKYLMALTRIFYNNILLLTVHMKVSSSKP